MTLTDLIPGAATAKVIGIVVAAAALFGGGWYVNGERLAASYGKQEIKDEQARAALLEGQVRIAANALEAATATLKGATTAYETAHADLEKYRDSIGARYAGVRLCRVEPAAGAGPPGAPAPSTSGDHGPDTGAVLPDATGPDLASLAADAEGLLQRAYLCRAYGQAVADWTARMKAGQAALGPH